MRWIKRRSKQSDNTEDHAPEGTAPDQEAAPQSTGDTPTETESHEALVQSMNQSVYTEEVLPQPQTEAFDTQEQLGLDLVQNVFTPMGTAQPEGEGERPPTSVAGTPGSSRPNIVRRTVIQPDEAEETSSIPDIPIAGETPPATRVRQRASSEAPTSGETPPETPESPDGPRVRQQVFDTAPTASEVATDIFTASQMPEEQAPRTRRRGAASQQGASPVGQGETVAAGQEATPRARQRGSAAAGQDAAPRPRQRGEAQAQTPATGSQGGNRPSSGGVLDSGELSLKDIFRKKTATNPRVKALLERHGTVDVQELADELQDFARSITAEEDFGRSLAAAEELLKTTSTEEKTQ